MTAGTAQWILSSLLIAALTSAVACGSDGDGGDGAGGQPSPDGGGDPTGDGGGAGADGGVGVDGAPSDGGITDGATPSDGGTPGDGGAGIATALSVTFLDACLLTPAGDARCWGRFLSGSPSPYATGKTWKSIATNINTYGRMDFCGVRPDDAVECVSEGQPAEVMNDRAYRSITVGYPAIGDISGHRCAIAATGALYCWGPNKSGQLGVGDTNPRTAPTQVGAATDWTYVSANQLYTCGIRGAGDLYCWGNGLGTGRLGDGSKTNKLEPTAVAGGGQWSQVSTGGGGTCGVRTDGRLFCWGDYYGSAGPATPTAIDAATDWSQVSVSSALVCARKTGGTVHCMGSNVLGAVGDGTRQNRATMTQVGSDTDWAEIGAGMIGACARKQNGKVYCWGDNKEGEVGIGPRAHLTPTRIDAPSTWKSIAVTEGRSCGVRSTGKLACWGSPFMSGPIEASPADVGTDTDWKSVSLGKHACATKNDDSLYCWGFGNSGDLGLGATTQASAPTALGITATDVAVSDGHACAIATDQSLYCWGSTTSYRAGGLSGPSNLTTPTKVGTDKWLDVATSKDGGCAVRSDHALFCFGGGSSMKQVGTATDWAAVSASYFDQYVAGLEAGTMQLVFSGASAATPWGTETTLTKIAVMGNMFGLRADGSLAGSGYNGDGALGNGSTNNTASKVFVDVAGGHKDWEAVSTGFAHACGLRAGGELHCWGNDSDGEVGDGSRYRLSPTPVLF